MEDAGHVDDLEHGVVRHRRRAGLLGRCLSLWLRRYLPQAPVLQPPDPDRHQRRPRRGRPGPAAGGVDGRRRNDTWPFVGTIGVAVSDLKPGGSAEFPYADATRTIAVISDCGYIPAGTRVIVREVRGNHVIVRPVG